MKGLKNSLAFGVDEMDAASLKRAGKFVAGPISHLINLSIRNREFPAKWKLARIIPLRKSMEMDPRDPGSFCPVCQLNVISKLAEKWIQSQLISHLERTAQLHPHHHAYRALRSTITAMIQITDTIAEATDDNKITTTMSVDQSAAFDCVLHEVLLEKLKFYSLGEQTLDWMRSYLSFRSSVVAIGSTVSQAAWMRHGVPQGSVLGPALYLLYTNEFPNLVNNDDPNNDDFCANISHKERVTLFGQPCKDCGTMISFADDGIFVRSSHSRHSNQDKIDAIYNRTKAYLNANGLKINEGKTSLTEFMTKQKRGRLQGIPPELMIQELVKDKIEDKLITDTPTCRILGSNFRNNLSWEGHLEKSKKAILPAIRRQLGALYSIQNALSFKARLKLANSLIVGKLGYMICLWGNSTDNQVRKAQIAQNAAARFVTKQKMTTRTTDLLKQCNWLSVKEMTECQSLVQIWKTLRWKKTEYMYCKLQIEEDGLLTTRPRLQLTASMFRWKAVDQWRMLPDNIRGQTELAKFKGQLKQWIKERRTIDPDPD